MYCANFYPKSPTSMAMQIEVVNEPYVGHSLEADRFDFTFSGRKTWWGGGWGLVSGNLKTYTAIMVNDDEKLYVRALADDYEDGIGMLTLSDKSTHEREKAMPVYLLAGERYWRGNSTHGNQIKHSIRCFGEKLWLEYGELGEHGGSVYHPGHARIPVEPCDPQYTRKEFVCDYIARVDGSYFAVCKSLEEPAVFVRIAAKDAASVFYKKDTDDVEEHSFVESAVKKRKVEAAPDRVTKIDMNFFVGAIDRGLVEPTGAGCVVLCNCFNQAVAFCERRDEIEALKHEQKLMLTQLQSDSLQNRFDTSLMDKIAAIQTQLNDLMASIEAAPSEIPPQAYVASPISTHVEQES